MTSRNVKQNIHYIPENEDPHLKITLGDKRAELTVTLSFDGDFLSLYNLPGDSDIKPTEDFARGELSYKVLAYVARLFAE